MNEFPLQPENNESIFLRMFTRPSPLPPDGLQLGVMEVCHVGHPKGELYPPQESYFCSLVWGVSGQYSLYVDDQRYTVRSGEFLLLEPGGILRVDADESENQAYYLLLDGPQSKMIVQKIGLWSGIFPYKRSPNIWLERIARDIDDLQNQQMLASIGHSLLVTAFHDAAEYASDKLVWDACCYLQKNWNQPGMNVENVLAHLNVSRSTLSPRFKKMAGQSILDYLMDIRYQKSRKMLAYDYASISKIAQRCGFPDASYFSTWFRKRSGVSPRAVKKKVAL